MKFLPLLTAFFLGAAALHADPSTYTAVATIITTGDSLIVTDTAGNTHVVRLAGVMAPAPLQIFGDVAAKALADKVLQKSVTVTVLATDKAERETAKVMQGEHWINLELVAAGDAWQNKNFGPDEDLAAAQAKARAAKLGLWAVPNAGTPLPSEMTATNSTPQAASNPTPAPAPVAPAPAPAPVATPVATPAPAPVATPTHSTTHTPASSTTKHHTSTATGTGTGVRY